MVNVSSLTTKVVLATMISAVLVALSTALPWYQTENRETGNNTYYYLDYGKSDSVGLFGYDGYNLEDLEFLMWVEKVFVYVWLIIAILFVLTCFLEGRGQALVHGFALLGVSLFTVVYFAARIERVNDWSDEASAGLGYVAILVAFVLQLLAVIGNSHYALTYVRASHKKVNDKKE